VDLTPPPLHWLMTLEVDVGQRRPLGEWQSGQRFIVDILGGRGQGHGFSAEVLPGGADRQWLRPDGAKELQAIYELVLDDGTVLSVHNEALLADGGQPARQAPCRARITAPTGPWGWLNQRLVVGDVTSLRPQAEAVRIRFFVVGPAALG
jgi:Protein of unknown function (DUF3237)